MFRRFKKFGLLTSGFTFDESESDLLFRFRILNYFLLIGAFFTALIGLLIVIALVTVETDEFRMVWFYIVAYFSYLLLNILAGIFFTSLSIIVILFANYFMDLHLSETAIYTAVFGLVVIGILSWASVTQLNEYERRQLIQHKKLKKNVKELDRALTEAKEADKIKSLFLANISHEIRTPMNGMMTFAQVLRTTELDQKQISYLNSIEQSGKLLKTLIDDLLDISSIEAGKLKISTKPVKVRSILDDALLQTQPLFDKKTIYYDTSNGDEIEFTYKLNDNVPDYIVADDVRLTQVIVNLISNARKFTKSGHVDLTIGTKGTSLPSVQKSTPFSKHFTNFQRNASKIQGLAWDYLLAKR